MEETIGRESPSDTLKTADEMEEELKALRTKTAELELEYVEFRRTWAALLRPDCHEIDDSRAREDGLSVEEKIRFEKKRVEQLESATRDDQIVASFGKMVTKDLEKKAAGERKKSKKRKKAKKSSKKKKASRSGDDDGDGDKDDQDDGSSGESSDCYADPFDISAEGDYNYMVAAVRNKKKTIKKNIGKWLKPFMGPPGGPPHEDEETARLFKMHVKNGVPPDEVMAFMEKTVALVAPIPMREGVKESLERITAAMVPHIEELDDDMSDIVFPDGFPGAPKRPANRWG